MNIQLQPGNQQQIHVSESYMFIDLRGLMISGFERFFGFILFMEIKNKKKDICKMSI